MSVKTDNVEEVGSKEEKTQMMIQQLIVLLHAQECLQLPKRKACSILHCDSVKGELISHMKSCKDYPNCTVENCNSSTEIILHWRNCHHLKCSICIPLRSKIEGVLERTASEDNLKLKDWNPSFTAFTRVVRIWNMVESIFGESEVEEEDKELAEEVVKQMELKIFKKAKNEKEYSGLMDKIATLYKEVKEEDDKDRED